MEEINLNQFIREIKINRNKIVNNDIYPFFTNNKRIK